MSAVKLTIIYMYLLTFFDNKNLISKIKNCFLHDYYNNNNDNSWKFVIKLKSVWSIFSVVAVLISIKRHFKLILNTWYF